jgi:hypothetical protein
MKNILRIQPPRLGLCPQIIKAAKILLLSLFLVGCSQEHSTFSLSSHEHKALKTFFTPFLFQEGGAFTLFGDKPMTFDLIQDVSELDPDEKESMVTDENWQNGWLKIRDKFKTPLFLLVERPSPLVEGRAVFLINIANTAIVIKKHHHELKEFVGFDFDPLHMVFEIENEESEFWNKVLRNDYFLGMFLGYGSDNAWLAQMHESSHENQQTSKLHDFVETIFSKSPASNSEAKTKEDFAFQLPSFGCYSKQQSTALLERYKQDRDRIRKLYKGKDIVEVTLHRLTSKDLPDDPNEKYKKLFVKYNS